MLFGLLLFVAVAGLAVFEATTSRIQAYFFSEQTRKIHYTVGPGASSSIRFPEKGPSDIRRGYTNIPSYTESLLRNSFQIESQSRFSPRMVELFDKGVYTIYPEKTQAGLRIHDRNGLVLFHINYPMKVFPSFDDIPHEVANTLLFIENRSLLDPAKPYKNPSVEWTRFGMAMLNMGKRMVGIPTDVAGGSTLATQLEKYRHSEEGRTVGPRQKIEQMASSSLRAYRNGMHTLDTRRQVLLDYINTVPLAALPGYGEVNGLGDGLLAWYGSSLDSVARRLSYPEAGRMDSALVDTGVDMQAMGNAYRQVLSLFIAHRRPTAYLVGNPNALHPITDAHLRLLGREGVISPQLRDAALQARPELMRRAVAFSPVAFVERKAANAIRSRLTTLLQIPGLYDLDRVDLTVESTLDRRAQEGVVRFFRNLADTTYLDSLGLRGFRLLDKGDPAKVIYSFTLYERVGNRNLIRVQADNYDQPLNINEGVKLDLGSTAKLRTLVNYLEIISRLHTQLSEKTPVEIQSVSVTPNDHLTRWAKNHMLTVEDKSLETMLRAAMDRTYSANPAERFFTGGGLHTFSNFNTNDDRKQLTVWEAMQRSNNLVFIRLMRDIVNYYMFQIPGSTALFLDSLDSPQRQSYLSKFAEKEGQVFLWNFFSKYRGKSDSAALDLLLHSVRASPTPLSVAYLSVHPRADVDQLTAFLRERTGDKSLPRADVERLHTQLLVADHNLADRGYLAGVHPLEIWTVAYLKRHPKATWSDVKESSNREVQAVYQWLFRTKRKHAQDLRIRGILEVEAFLEIHKAWQRTGYSFGSLVPSYATSIGSSADRPNSLAELVGILLNEGVHYPSILISKLHFAENTPYETLVRRQESEGERKLPAEVARVALESLQRVVQQGTAIRAAKAFPLPDGTFLALGGKTGTGDQRYETYGRGGQVLESRVVNRTATFVFFLGERFFGTVTAHVQGEKAAEYSFTSSLPVEIIRQLSPALTPLLAEPTPSKALLR